MPGSAIVEMLDNRWGIPGRLGAQTRLNLLSSLDQAFTEDSIQPVVISYASPEEGGNPGLIIGMES
jgi:hypothetical protein